MNKLMILILGLVIACVQCQGIRKRRMGFLRRPRRSTSDVCYFNGVPVSVGETYKDPSVNCLEYECTGHETTKIVKEGCFNQTSGTCLSVGEYTRPCGVATCSKFEENNQLRYTLSYRATHCTDDEGYCHAPNSNNPFRKTNNNLLYSCFCSADVRYERCTLVPQPPSTVTDAPKLNCSANGNDIAHGDTFIGTNCDKYKCEDGKKILHRYGCRDERAICRTSESGRFYVYNRGEKYSCMCSNKKTGHKYINCKGGCTENGNKYSHGEKFKYNCGNYECNNGNKKLIKQECIDKDGQCKTPESGRFLKIDNEIEKSCLCVVNQDGRASYDCQTLEKTTPPIPSTTTKSTTTPAPTPPPKRGCSIDGLKVDHGDLFKLKDRSPCFEYKCDNGTAKLVSEGCQVDGICHSVGIAFKRGNCDTYVCKKTVEHGIAWFRTSVVGRRCEDKDGQCHEPGSFFSRIVNGQVKDNCTCRVENSHVFYQCSPRPEDATQSDNTAVCEMYGDVYKDGDEFTHAKEKNCIKYKCNNGNITVLSESCIVNDRCVPIGHTWNDGCLKFRCGKVQTSRGLEFFPEASPYNCRDMHGQCKEQGSLFYHKIHGVDYPNCTCRMQVDANTMRYTCIEAKCNVEGKTYTHGERFYTESRGPCVKYFCWHGGWGIVPGDSGCEGENSTCHKPDPSKTFGKGDCQLYTCEKRTGDNGVEDIHTVPAGGKCQDAEGVCRDQGSRFKYKQNGEVKDDCTCHFENGKMKYTCIL